MAFETTRPLALEEGIFVAMSNGAAVTVAIQVARTISKGTIVVILLGRGDR